MPKPLEKRLNWGRLRQRYKQSSAQRKSQLLDEIYDLTQMNRKYVIRKLNQSSHKPSAKRGASPIYAPQIYRPILQKIWFACDQLCSKKLKPKILS